MTGKKGKSTSDKAKSVSPDKSINSKQAKQSLTEDKQQKKKREAKSELKAKPQNQKQIQSKSKKSANSNKRRNSFESEVESEVSLQMLGKHKQSKPLDRAEIGSDFVVDKKDIDYIDAVAQEGSLGQDWINQIKQIYQEKFPEEFMLPKHTIDEFINTVRRIFGAFQIVKGKPQYNDFQALLLKYHKNQQTVAGRKKQTLKSSTRPKSPLKNPSKLHIKFLDPISYKIATEKDYLDPRDDTIVAQAISIGTDDAFKSKYLERDVKNWSEYIDNFKESKEVNSNEILRTIQNRNYVPDYAIFKAVSQAYPLLLKNDEVACLQWFQTVIQPVVRDNYFYSNLNGTESKDLEKVAQIIVKLRSLHTMIDENEALKLCQILQKAGQHANFIRQRFCNENYSTAFWKSVIYLFFKYDKQDSACVDIIMKNKESLFTDALILFKSSKILSQDFLEALTPFQPLTSQELKLFYDSTINEQFFNLTKLLKANIKHSFTTFMQVTSSYQRLTNAQQVDTMNKFLINKPLDSWSSYQQQIFSSIGDMDDKTTSEIIIKTFNKLSNEQIWFPTGIDSDYRKVLDSYWTIVIQLLEEKMIISKEWQKELVYRICDIIENKKQKFIVVQLETGHGKSIVCQEIATILKYLHLGSSIICCANEFLAYYSEFAYSKESQQDYISYYSLNRLLHSDVTDQFIITDEHDVMAGLNSFYLLDDHFDPKVTAKYTPSIFSKSKGLIAFSGTISSALKQQLNWMNPQAIFVEIPSLKNESQKNVIKNYIHSEDETNTFEKILEVIQDETEYQNFIVIFENKLVLDRFFEAHQNEFDENKQVFIFDDFSSHSNFPIYQKMLKELSTCDFIVLTVKDGSRGVDFKGRSPAHVIIACDIDHYAGIVQALGRGSRDLKNISTGTLITKRSYDNAMDILPLLKSEDQHKGKSAPVNHLIASILHDKIGYWPQNIQKEELKEIKLNRQKAFQKMNKKKDNNEDEGCLELIMFKSHFKKGLLFEGDELILWKYIKQKYDNDKILPENPMYLSQYQVKELIKKII